jgi:4-diphosphocytidyl-2-C-methyl-D-erythritol kinase
MGGGSSDAAGMLQGLQKLFEVSLTDAELKKAAETIGSDVSFFLYDGPDYDAAIVTGRGENVRYIKSRRDLFYVLVCPGVHSSTKEAYDLVDNWNNGDSTAFPSLSDLEAIYRSPVKNWAFENSFTKPIAWKYPIIQKAIQDVKSFNPDFVEMTGSGSVVFGIFSSENDAKKAYTQLCQIWKESYLLKTT